MASTSDRDDLPLLRAWCSGSAAAGDDLARRWVPPLRRFFTNKVGDATDDLVQQTLVGVTKHRHKILDSGLVRMWLFRIARSRLYDFLRASGRGAETYEDEVEDDSIFETNTTFTGKVARARTEEEVRRALRNLPLDLQVVVELHYWEDQSTVEIASVLEIPQGTVKSRLRRAREALEICLGTEAEGVRDWLGRARPR